MSRRLDALKLAIALAIPAEGLYLYAYYDPPGILTVCYGSTTNVEKGRKYSLDECKTRLDKDMLAAIDQVDRCVPGLPERPLAAFADAVYNMGPAIACNTKESTAARFLKAGRIADACNQLPRWNKSKIKGVFRELLGLTTRREAERQLCLS